LEAAALRLIGGALKHFLEVLEVLAANEAFHGNLTGA
jgi:hypothetical protein